MGKRYVIDEETGEAVSPEEKKIRDKERLPETPFNLYVPTSSKNLPNKASSDKVLDMMKSCELGFVKGVLFNDHEYLIFGDIEIEELKPFSDVPFQSKMIGETTIHLSHAKKFHELSFKDERDEQVVAYQTAEPEAWRELLKRLKT